MLMAYLLTTHRISNAMSAYQLLRNSLNFLGEKIIHTSLARKVELCACFPWSSFSFHAAASTDLSVDGISLAKNPDATAVSGHRT